MTGPAETVMNAPVTTLRTAAESELSAQFVDARPEGAASIRQRAFDRAEKAGLPHRRIEAWHYTDLRAKMRRAEAPAPHAAIAAPAMPLGDGLATALFVNGWRQGALPSLPGSTILGLAEALAANDAATMALIGKAFDTTEDAVSNLNTAFMTDGLVIRVPAGITVETPFHVAFETVLAQAAAMTTRVIVELGAGASLTLVESHRGPDGIAYQTNTMLEVSLGEGAMIEHVRVNAAGKAAQVLSTMTASVGADATLRSTGVSFGGSLARTQIMALVHGDDARVDIGGATLINGSQHADNTLLLIHDALRGESRETFKTVVDDEATGVFQGKIVVKAHAQKTDGRMSSNALLLGETAAMHAKPELEIFADDVQCAHGATAGALDHDLLFYLMARGLPRKEAEALMIQAFCGEAIERVSHEGLRQALAGLVGERVGTRIA
jgi:Fe-S cluster assembly protein SufD